MPPQSALTARGQHSYFGTEALRLPPSPPPPPVLLPFLSPYAVAVRAVAFGLVSADMYGSPCEWHIPLVLVRRGEECLSNAGFHGRTCSASPFKSQRSSSSLTQLCLKHDRPCVKSSTTCPPAERTIAVSLQQMGCKHEPMVACAVGANAANRSGAVMWCALLLPWKFKQSIAPLHPLR